MLEISELEERLKAAIDEKRYIHSISVGQTSVELAKLYGCSEEKALYAGLLHDCAKCYGHKESVARCKEFMLNVKDLSKGVMHSFLGAEIAKTEYFVDDVDILNAIRYHCTGRPNMSLLEKIVLIADMIEPNRDYDGIVELRKLAREDINITLAASIKRKIEFVIEDGKQADRLSMLALDCYRNYLK